MTKSRWRLTPGRWLMLKVASVVPIALFTDRVVVFLPPRELVMIMVIPMAIILLDGLVTMWTYARQSKAA